MPKDEFDFDDPLELNGVALYTEEDTSRGMAECFVEEFMRLGYNHKQLLALFRNPHYLGLNMVLQNKGEPFVREVIAEMFAKWGRLISWSEAAGMPLTPSRSPSEGERENHPPSVGGTAVSVLPTASEPSKPTSEQAIILDLDLTDPMGNPIPKLE